MPEVRKSLVMSRRKSPRLEVEDEVSIACADLETPMRVRDVSFDGFLLETPRPVVVGESQLFHLRTPSEPMLFVRATSRYCRKLPDREMYLSGWSADSERAEQTLMEAINAMTGMIAFD